MINPWPGDLVDFRLALPPILAYLIAAACVCVSSWAFIVSILARRRGLSGPPGGNGQPAQSEADGSPEVVSSQSSVVSPEKASAAGEGVL